MRLTGDPLTADEWARVQAVADHARRLVAPALGSEFGVVLVVFPMPDAQGVVAGVAVASNAGRDTARAILIAATAISQIVEPTTTGPEGTA